MRDIQLEQFLSVGTASEQTGESAEPIYLDYAATTPVDPRVAEVMSRCLTPTGMFGNPASSHSWGQQAIAVVDQATEYLATLMGCSAKSLVFTSGATEANNLAIIGAAEFLAERRGKHLITSRIEHKSVVDCMLELERRGFEVTWLEPAADGLHDPQSIKDALREDTSLVSIMLINNEIGVQQDVISIGEYCRANGSLLHVDATQACGKIPLQLEQWPVDLASISGHKFYGPKGVGALYVQQRPRVWLQPQMLGGGHQRGLRSGTLATHQIAGMGAAAELAQLQLSDDMLRSRRLRLQLWSQLQAKLPAIELNGHAEQRAPGLLNFSVHGVHGEALLASLPLLAISSGSACTSASREPSYVLRALGRDDGLAEASLRISVGRFTTHSDIDEAARQIIEQVQRLRRLSPRWQAHTDAHTQASIQGNIPANNSAATGEEA